jgi:predicted transcriptional regulator
MTSARLDQNVEKFIYACINSVEQLEILLLLRSRTELDADTITQELRTTASSVEKRLADLMRKNLVGMREHEGKRTYRYDPPPHLAENVDQLASLYTTHRVSIINLIFSKPSDALTGFSDAFRFKE